MLSNSCNECNLRREDVEGAEAIGHRETAGFWSGQQTHSVVLCKSGDWQGHGQGAEETVDAISEQGSLDAAPVGGACSLDARHLGGGGDVSDDLHTQDYEAHQVG